MVQQGAKNHGRIPRVSYAQNMEDILLDRLFGDHVGSFVDVGANNPFVDSNTQFFHLRGWRGVNIEPTRAGHEQFVEHRPDDLNLAVAVSDAEGELRFFEVWDAGGHNGLSTFSAEMADRHRARGDRVVDSLVPVRTLASLIDEHRIEAPDFVSIDVECHEDRVIRGIPLDSWRPKVFVVESTLPWTDEPCYEAWEPILLEHGYLFAAFNGINRFYLRDDLADKLDLFRSPVNVLDSYVRAEYANLEERMRRLSEQYDWLKVEHHELEQGHDAWEALHTRQDQERASWQSALAGLRHLVASWESERADIARERTDMARERAEFAQEREGFARERADMARERDEFARGRADFERERADFERGRVQFYESRVVYELQRQEHEHRHQELVHLRETLAQLSDAWGRERGAWEREREDRLRELVATQRLLRPYRLLDRLGVIAAGYRWARKVKHRWAS